QGEQLLGAFGGDGEAGRIVSRRLAVEEFRRVTRHQALQRIRPRALVVPWRGEELRAERAEHLRGPWVGRLVDRDDVAGIDERSRDEIEPLLRSVDDQNFIRTRLDAEAQEVRREIAPQGRIAGRRVILEDVFALVTDDLVENPAEWLGRKESA